MWPRPWYRPVDEGEAGIDVAATATGSCEAEVRSPVCSVCSGRADEPKYILLGRPRKVRPDGSQNQTFSSGIISKVSNTTRRTDSPTWRTCSETSALMSEKSHMARKLSKHEPSSASWRRMERMSGGGSQEEANTEVYLDVGLVGEGVVVSHGSQEHFYADDEVLLVTNKRRDEMRWFLCISLTSKLFLLQIIVTFQRGHKAAAFILKG